jgi:hypothetical protein
LDSAKSQATEEYLSSLAQHPSSYSLLRGRGWKRDGQHFIAEVKAVWDAENLAAAWQGLASLLF